MAALDIGGTKIDAGIVAGDGTALSRIRRPTEAANADSLGELVVDLLTQQEAFASAEAVGVSCAGPLSGFSRTGAEFVSPLNIDLWNDFPLRRFLSRAIDLPIYVDHDAKALALSESQWGAAIGEADFLAMVVSTGVGGGIVLNGHPLDGRHGNAGHIGHVIVEPEGRLCPCGARGCLEAEVAGPAITARCGVDPADAPISERRRAGRLVGRTVASVANLMDLQLAVVAGSVALGFGEPFFSAAQQEIDRLALLEFSRGTQIVPAGLGADGPLLGAAMVAHYRGSR